MWEQDLMESRKKRLKNKQREKEEKKEQKTGIEVRGHVRLLPVIWVTPVSLGTTMAVDSSV
jgi:hypothetical protein